MVATKRQSPLSSPAAPSTPTRAAVVGATQPSPLTGGIWVRKHDLAVGDVYTKRIGWRAGETPRWVSARIVSVDKVSKTMQITFDETEAKTIHTRDLIVIAGPKLVAAKANPALVANRGGRHVWCGEQAVRA